MAIRHHRKLLSEELTNSTLSVICYNPCNDSMNESGFCISPCLDQCPHVCRYDVTDLIPPTETSTLPDYSSPPETSHHLPPLLITTFVALALTIVIIGCYLIFVRYFSRGRTRRRSIVLPQQTTPRPDDEEFFDQGPVLDHPIWYIRTVGLQPSVISKITLCKYKSGDGLVEGTECSVCLSEFEEDETLRLLPKCSHAFHISCIDTWLRSHTNCPNCRAPIVTNVARSPSPESSTDNSITWEEIRLDENHADGMSSGIENDPQIRGETEVETEESDGNGSGNGSIAEEVKTDMQLLRRSVSVDSLSATKISLAVADFLAGKSDRKSDSDLDYEENQDQETGIVPKRLSGGGIRLVDNGSSSIGSSSSMKRSLSLSGRFSLSKYSRSRSRSLVLPL